MVKELLSNEEFESHLYNSRLLSKENCFLAFLYKIKSGFPIIFIFNVTKIIFTGSNNKEMAIKFGGGDSFHSKLFLDSIDRLVFYFARYITIPNKSEADYHKKYLER